MREGRPKKDPDIWLTKKKGVEVLKITELKTKQEMMLFFQLSCNLIKMTETDPLLASSRPLSSVSKVGFLTNAIPKIIVIDDCFCF